MLLGVGRGFGETMAVLMASGHSINLPDQRLRLGARADRDHRRRAGRDGASGSDHYQALFTIGIFLFVITFIINLAADLVVRGIRRKS